MFLNGASAPTGKPQIRPNLAVFTALFFSTGAGVKPNICDRRGSGVQHMFTKLMLS